MGWACVPSVQAMGSVFRTRNAWRFEYQDAALLAGLEYDHRCDQPGPRPTS